MRKNIKVLFMSGYTEKEVIEGGLLDKDHIFLQKPFRPLDLVRKVRKTLDE